MNKRRKLLSTLGAALLAAPLTAYAQSAGKIYRIGYLGPTSAVGARTRLEALRAGLRELGYVEGKNLTLELRWADDKYDLLPQLAGELVRLKVDVIVTHSTPGARAAKQATTTIPIVMATAGDAVLAGLVASITKPEANLTGSTFSTPELAAKRLEVLKDTFPRIRHVAVLHNPENPAMGPVLKAMEQAAKLLKLDLLQVAVRATGDFEQAFAQMAAKHVEAFAPVEDAILNSNIARIADLAIKHRLPAIGLPELAEAGGLMAYGVDLVALFRRAAYFVDKILKGTPLARLPLERASRFELIINMKTAQTIGVKFPQEILVRADRVIK